MRIPGAFFGTLNSAKANCKKINTLLKRGKSLEECISDFPEIDSSDFPNSLIWVDKAWSMAGASQHFILCEFSYTLDGDKRFDHDRRNKIYNESVDWLATSAWGALTLNGTQNYSWVMNLPWTLGPRSMGEYAVLKSFRDKYEDLAREGDIFYTGGISGCGLAGVFLQVIRVITNMDDKYSDLISECIIPGLKIHYDKIHQIIVNNRLVEDFFEITKERNFA